ncbi:MAG: fatty acid desaturase [Candidatus Poseidoniaceae archaeon]|jgi:alkane 1-monooxygenase|nr:fatty acid desaturase [Candidatus Poseidoniaceae archaeon]
MDTHEEGWIPHLLGFILPIITISSLFVGGYWMFSGFVFAVGIGPFLDLIFPDRAPTRGEINKFAWNSLLASHSIFVFISIGVLLWRADLDGFTLQVALGALSVGIVSGISGIVNAHEQGHRRKGSKLWWMARLNLLLVLYLHFTTEHNNGHHRNYATVKDPASSPRGRGYWVHLLQTVPRQFVSAYKTNSRKGATLFTNSTIRGMIIQIALVGIIWYYSSAMVFAFLINAGLAIILLEYVNYMQHYGLRREVGERHTMMHSWESRSTWSRWTLLELPLHPAHHLKASDPIWELRAYEKSPQLPSGYYYCLWLALIPPLWKWVMDKKLDSLIAESSS